MSVINIARRAIVRVPLALSPRENIEAAAEAVRRLWKSRSLVGEMVRRDLGGQFAGQILGRLWIIGHPLALFSIYLIVFAAVLKVRMNTSTAMPRDYATYILTGLATWLSLQQGIIRATTVLTGQANLVKQVVFPIEALPFGSAIVSMVPQLVGLTLLFFYTLITNGGLPWTYILLPFLLVLSLMLLTGISFLLSALTPFVRDIKDFAAVLSVVGVYLVPAFYLPQWMPRHLRPLIYANPFSHVVWVYQDALYYGRFEHPVSWVIFVFSAVFIFSSGYRVFRDLKPYIANVL